MAEAIRLEFADQSEIAHGTCLDWLAELAERALPKVLAIAIAESPLTTLTEVEFTLVTDETIAQVHEEFMQVPGATDVITFHHGEVVISVETAATQAVDFARTTADEVALYVIHGLLHLAGYDDKTPEAFGSMAILQERILQECNAT